LLKVKISDEYSYRAFTADELCLRQIWYDFVESAKSGNRKIVGKSRVIVWSGINQEKCKEDV